jgi:hypothetical protein
LPGLQDQTAGNVCLRESENLNPIDVVYCTPNLSDVNQVHDCGVC